MLLFLQKTFIKNGGIDRLLGGYTIKATPTMGNYAKDFFKRTDKDSIRYYNISHDNILSSYCHKQRQDLLDNYIMSHYRNVKLTDVRTQEIDRWFVSLRARMSKHARIA